MPLFPAQSCDFSGYLPGPEGEFQPSPLPLSRIFATSFVEMPAGEGIGMSKNRSNVEKHTFDLFFADSLKMSELFSAKTS
jgi:hypothetical protein